MSVSAAFPPSEYTPVQGAPESTGPVESPRFTPESAGERVSQLPSPAVPQTNPVSTDPIVVTPNQTAPLAEIPTPSVLTEQQLTSIGAGKFVEKIETAAAAVWNAIWGLFTTSPAKSAMESAPENASHRHF